MDWKEFSRKFRLGIFCLFMVLLSFSLFNSFRKKQDISSPELTQRIINFKNVVYWFQLQAATNPDFNPVVVDDSGRILYSWRIPYFSINSPRAFSINEPWSSPENISSEFYGEDAFCELNSTNPYMMAVVDTKGKEKVFSGIELLKREGGYARDLIILVEVYAPSVHWMEPIDLCLEDFSSNNQFSAISNEAGIERLGSPERAGILVGFANGDVWLIRKSIPRSLLEKFVSSSSQLLDKDELLAPYRLPIP